MYRRACVRPTAIGLRTLSWVFLLSLAVAGCSTTATKMRTGERTAAGAKKPGGYYLDDGPGDNPPPNLDRIADAVPRDEPLHRFANRPYSVLGETYTPLTESAPYKEQGMASWYGRRFNAKNTSSGEPYDMYAMSGAHKTLPIPSYVRVTNLANRKSVVVRINDRGPFLNSRLIDLSYAAAYKLGYTQTGSAMVEVERVFPADTVPMTAALPSNVLPVATALPAPELKAYTEPAASSAGVNGVFVQMAAFGTRENAEAFARKLKAEYAWLAPLVQIADIDSLFRVRSGPYATRAEADEVASRIRQTMAISPLIIQP